jgi:hypothetical protein
MIYAVRLGWGTLAIKAGFVSVEMLGDLFDAHPSRCAITLARQAEDHSHGLGVDGIDLQYLLGVTTVLLGGFHDAGSRSAAGRRSRSPGGRSPSWPARHKHGYRKATRRIASCTKK